MMTRPELSADASSGEQTLEPTTTTMESAAPGFPFPGTTHSPFLSFRNNKKKSSPSPFPEHLLDNSFGRFSLKYSRKHLN